MRVVTLRPCAPKGEGMNVTDFGNLAVWLRALSFASLAFFLVGCFTSDVPAITAQTAEDVGSTLEYWLDDGQEESRQRMTKIGFVRQKDTGYQLQLSGPDNLPEPFANGLYLRRLGSRDGSPVFLVQFDLARFELDPDVSPEQMGFGFMFYPVSIDDEKLGRVGMVNCDDKAVVAAGQTYGVELSCVEYGWDPIPHINNRPDEAQIWAFLQELLQAGLFEWEDTRKQGALDSDF